MKYLTYNPASKIVGYLDNLSPSLYNYPKIQVTDEQYQAVLKNPGKYLVQNDTLIINPTATVKSGNGSDDDTAAINASLKKVGDELAANQSLGISGKAIVFLAGGTYKISAPIKIPTGVTLQGETKSPPYPNRVSGFKSNQNLFTGTEIVCASNFSGGDSAIDMAADNASVENLILDGHSIPSGTCYTNLKVTTAQGKTVSTGVIKFPVSDSSDFRQPKVIAIDTWEIPYFEVGKYYEYQLAAWGSTGTYTWSITSGTLPAGLTLSSSGLISGTATARELNYVTFKVTDGTNNHSATFPIGTVLDYITTRDILPLTAGSSYSFTLQKRNSSAAVWHSPNLPSFLSLNSTTGEITCPTPANAIPGDYEIRINLKHTVNSVTTIIDTRIFQLKVSYADAGVRLFYENYLKTNVNSPFSYQYRAYGNYGAYTWTIETSRSSPDNTFSGYPTATSPCPGLTLNTSTGVISGTPTSTGKAVFYIKAISVADPNNYYWTDKATIEVTAAGSIPRLYSRSIKPAIKGQAYNWQFNVEAIAGAQPYVYSAVNLPDGLSINSSTGIISGTPTGSTFVNGVRLRWSDNVKDCVIRGFRSGAGIVSGAIAQVGASNLHRIHSTLIGACDSGFYSPSQTYDSHFWDLYIYNCRIGLDLNSGSAGLSFVESRIEFIHENGVQMNYAHEDDFVGVYFDTCGWNAMKISNSKNAIISACRFYRSGRNLRGIGNPFQPQAKSDLSSHVQLQASPRTIISGCNFNLGSDDGGDGLYFSLDSNHDSAKPMHCISFFNCEQLTIAGNVLTGCISNSLNFIGGDYDSVAIGTNNYAGKYFQPYKPTAETIYTPNACFQVWQRQTTFNIPVALTDTSSTYEVADFWKLRRGGTSRINQITTITRGTGLEFAGGNYLNITKPVNTTAAPSDNNQVLELENTYSKGIKLTSDRKVVVSFWAKSANSNSVSLKLGQYADSSANSFAANTYISSRFTLSPQWKRYYYYFDPDDLTNVVPGANATLTIAFLFDRWNEAVNTDLTGIQIDIASDNPLPKELRVGTFESELKEAQRWYQKGKPYNLYFPSWGSDGQLYATGANWEEGWLQAYSPSMNMDGSLVTASVSFENPLKEKPGNPTTNGAIAQKVKLFNPQYAATIKTDSNANKYKWNGSSSFINPYIEQISTTGMRVSARGATSAGATAYSLHWWISFYSQDQW